MKLFYIALLALSLVSCKKDKNCMDCHIQGQLNGVTHDRWEVYCGDDPNPQYYDDWGNPISTTCTRR